MTEQIDLYRLGRRGGGYVAVRGTGQDRERLSISAKTEAEAEREISRFNETILTKGVRDLNACLALYRTKQRGAKWTRDDERNEGRVRDYFGGIAIDDIDIDVCEQFADDRRDDGLSENSIRIELSHLRAALNFAEQRKLIARAPKLYVPTSQEVREWFLSREDAQRLLHVDMPDHVRLYIMTALVTGGRPSHILQLKYDRINLAEQFVDFRRAGEQASNKRRPRVSITKTLSDMIGAARETSQSGYLIEWQGQPVKEVRKGLAGAATRAQIFARSPFGDMKVPTPYDLRHTAGTLMAMDGVPIEEIAERLGHEKLDTTRKHYNHLTPEYQVRSRDSLDFKIGD